MSNRIDSLSDKLQQRATSMRAPGVTKRGERAEAEEPPEEPERDYREERRREARPARSEGRRRVQRRDEDRPRTGRAAR
jgi:hypothetical protein